MDFISYFQYTGLLLGMLVVWAGIRLKGVENKWQYFKSEEGKKILKGIKIALIFSLLVPLLFLSTGCANKGSYLNDAHIFAGLDATKDSPSPQCKDEGPDTRTTSNLGFKVNGWRSEDKKTNVNLKYTHHSCAFSPDSETYDGIGIEVERKIWSRQ